MSARTLFVRKPWGEVRYTSGSSSTNRTYTVQRSEVGSIGFMYYNTRWYDPYLNRWIQPDTIVPLESQGIQAWDRYAYVNNNPVNNNDPTGHCVWSSGGTCYVQDNNEVHVQNGISISEISSALATNPQRAIDLAITYYGFDGEIADKGLEGRIIFDNKQKNSTLGPADKPLLQRDGTITIGFSAIDTPGILGETIGHELIHYDQWLRGDYYVPSLDDRGNTLPSPGVDVNEIEAYQWEIDTYYNGNRFGLTETEHFESINLRARSGKDLNSHLANGYSAQNQPKYPAPE